MTEPVTEPLPVTTAGQASSAGPAWSVGGPAWSVGGPALSGGPAPALPASPASSDLGLSHGAPSPGASPSETRVGSREWSWVTQWRQNGEPTPWAPGLVLALFTALLVGSAVYTLNSGLSDWLLIAVAVNLVVAGGLVPAIWLARDLPVLRWMAAGAVLGILGGWLAALLFLL